MSWPTRVSAITLVVEDLAAARAFYLRAFELPVHYEDADSCVFDIGGTLVNLLVSSGAGELLEPAAVGAPGESRLVLTIPVDDVDAICSRLNTQGVCLLNGPVDRPWGIRTASFRDPDGHVWEIAR